jgi:hypothetical protein
MVTNLKRFQSLGDTSPNYSPSGDKVALEFFNAAFGTTDAAFGRRDERFCIESNALLCGRGKLSSREINFSADNCGYAVLNELACPTPAKQTGRQVEPSRSNPAALPS